MEIVLIRSVYAKRDQMCDDIETCQGRKKITARKMREGYSPSSIGVDFDSGARQEKLKRRSTPKGTEREHQQQAQPVRKGLVLTETIQ